MVDDLIKKAQTGDEKAFEKMVKAYQNLVYTLALRMLANRDDALDASQDVFVRVWRSLGKFEGRSEFSTWIYRITANTCIDYIKKKRRDSRISLTWPENEEERFAQKGPSLEEEFQQMEAKDSVDRVLEQMNFSYRSVLVLRDIYGFSYEEIASILKISLQATKIRIYRARLDFKSRLRQLEREEKGG